MYICVSVSTLYQARGVSSPVCVRVGTTLLWLDTHTHIYTWLLTPLAWYPHTYIQDYSLLWLGTHTHIYKTTHSSGLAPTHIYTRLLTPLAWYPHTYIHDYSLLWLGTHTHIYMTTHSSGLVPTHIYTWLLTPLAWYPHTYIHDYSLLWLDTHTHIYMTVYGYQARVVSSHVYMCVGTKPDEWVVMYICVWVSSQRSE
jgi:hypothetical protein